MHLSHNLEVRKEFHVLHVEPKQKKIKQIEEVLHLKKTALEALISNEAFERLKAIYTEKSQVLLEARMAFQNKWLGASRVEWSGEATEGRVAATITCKSGSFQIFLMPMHWFGGPLTRLRLLTPDAPVCATITNTVTYSGTSTMRPTTAFQCIVDNTAAVRTISSVPEMRTPSR